MYNLTHCSREACWNWKAPELALEETLEARGSDYNGFHVSRGYFGSFCMDGLAMALHAVYTTNSFEEAVTKAVNMLGDADSVGAIARTAGWCLLWISSNAKISATPLDLG